MSRLPMLLLMLATIPPASAAEVPHFVSGFDRFGRHGEVDQATAGRVLLSELSCTACHQPEDRILASRSGPRLDGVADRLDEKWIRRFLAAPQSAKPGTTMPDVLASVPQSERAGAIDALLAFLSTQHEPWPNIRASGANPILHRFWERGDVENGRRLYHTVGCVACHEADPDYETVETKPTPLDELLEQLDPDEIAEMGLEAKVRPVNPVPHADLPAKYSLQSLTHFLIDPKATRPGGRMPSLKLKALEAADIAAWLLRDQSLPITLPAASGDSEQIAQGRQLFAELGCANCHSAGEVRAKPHKRLAALDVDSPQSCIGPPATGLPHYRLDDQQRTSMLAALDVTGKSETPADRLDLQLLQLNCYGCHDRDERGGVGRNLRPYFETAGHVDIGDEGRIPPPLTGVGRKLRSEWIRTVLQGRGDVRPYMLARMPLFPGRIVGGLPDLLAQVDRDGESSAEPSLEQIADAAGGSNGSTSPEALVEAGRKLMDVGCVQCHAFRGEALPGVVGIDLAGTADRIRPGWFHEFLRDPGALKSRTRMPSFFPGGKSQNAGILEGDPDRQIAAMWAYLKAGEAVPLPAKIDEVRRQDFELKPTGRPIIMRTFMPRAGTHAIAVGLPAGVHYAFDAEHLRLTRLWKGRFLDAQGTWFSRFAPPADPLGEPIVTLPPGPPLAWLSDADQPWPTGEDAMAGNRFRGYRLDAAGVPTLLYEIGPANVEDRLTARGEGELVRQMSVTLREGKRPPEGQLWLRACAGGNLKADGDRCLSQNGLSVSVSGSGSTKLRTSEKAAEWLVPITIDADPVTVEVRYQW